MPTSPSTPPRAQPPVDREEKAPPRPEAPPVRTMHDDVDPCSDDICCCEPEPRWQELAGDDHQQVRLRCHDDEQA